MNYDLYSQLESFNTKLTMNTLGFLMECGEMLKVDKGTTLSKEGEPSDHVYFIVDGTAGIEKNDGLGGRLKLATVESGGLIGEMGVFLNMKRTATVVAYTDLSLIKFTNENFINSLPKTPDITVRLLKSLSNKLEGVNQKVSEVTARNAMLMIGMSLMDYPDETTQIRLDVGKLNKETGMSPSMIVSGLKALLKAGLIKPWKLEEGKILAFSTDLVKLRAGLKRLRA